MASINVQMLLVENRLSTEFKDGVMRQFSKRSSCRKQVGCCLETSPSAPVVRMGTCGTPN